MILAIELDLFVIVHVTISDLHNSSLRENNTFKFDRYNIPIPP